MAFINICYRAYIAYCQAIVAQCRNNIAGAGRNTGGCCPYFKFQALQGT